MDVVWSILAFSGIEKLHIVPGFTEANAYDLYYMPYTHGLPGSIAISLVLDVIVAMFTSGDRAMTIFLVAAASFSHWLLDLIVHVPDLPLYDNTAKVGFGLWRHVTLCFPLELIVVGLGAWLYARMTRFTSANGQYLYWGFVAVLAALQVYANFGPPPLSPETMAMTALFLYGVFQCLLRQNGTGQSGPHDFAVRIACRSSSAHPRPPHPTARFVTIASRPSCRVRQAK
jgi:hypothetical protein